MQKPVRDEIPNLTFWFKFRIVFFRVSYGTKSFSKGGQVWGEKGSDTGSMPPMNEPVPGLPTPIYSTLKEENQQTLVTELPNGLKVASEYRFGEFCTVGGKSVCIT